MDIGKLLDITLVNTSNFTLTVYTLIIAILIVISTMIILKLIKRIIRRYILKDSIDQGTYWSIYLIIRYFVWVIVAILIMDTVGVKISVLLASIAALLVGVGLGIQQLFGDIASGIVMLIERNLKIQDVIQLEDGIFGKVTEIGLRTTKIITRDDIIMIVPNSKFVNDRIINWSHIDFKTRFHVNVGVAYGSDVQLVKKCLLECASEIKHVAEKPEPFVRFNDFGESSLDFQLYFWVMESFRVENLKSDLRFLIDQKFRENGVTIPFPQRDLHIKSNNTELR